MNEYNKKIAKDQGGMIFLGDEAFIGKIEGF